MTASWAPCAACGFRPEKRFSWRLVGFLLVAPVLLISLNSDACGEPPKYETMALRDSPKKYYEVGEEVYYQCYPGYLTLRSVVTYCEQNHSWYPLEEACFRKECNTPGLENGEVFAPNFTFQFDSEAYFYCNEGYYLSGKKALLCELRGDDVFWSDEFPKCYMVKCDYPVIEHGRLVSGIRDKYSYQAVVLFECIPGFYLNGSNPVFCGGRSTWEPAMPKCIRGFKPTHPTKPPVLKYPGYPEPNDPLTFEDFEELDAGIIAVIVLTILVGLAVLCTCLYRCFQREKKGDTWVAQSVKRLPSAQLMIPGSWDRVPHQALCLAGSLLLLLPLPATHPACVLSLSLTNK
ncbi:membrane cofactor protein-like isoform X10 [Mirounga angustirostris]|uniref:membrane cofactor protein-like isoform X5 n=1 Tax=Mirounga leonina TaxID=9715 RepID=UPI00156C2386|nr:membrane cofactor protein-like isoform X5 [Mirounga leonina]